MYEGLGDFIARRRFLFEKLLRPFFGPLTMHLHSSLRRVHRSARRFALAIAIVGGSAALHRSVQAGYPETFERVERLLGVGWGDGYQACRSSGIRPLADCPPRTYASQHNSPLDRVRGCKSGTGVRSFYDAFDDQCDRLGGTVAPMFPKTNAACDACDGSTPIVWSDQIEAAETPFHGSLHGHAPHNHTHRVQSPTLAAPVQPTVPHTETDNQSTKMTTADGSAEEENQVDDDESLLIEPTSESSIESPSDIGIDATTDEAIDDAIESPDESNEASTSLPRRLKSPSFLTNKPAADSELLIGEDLPVQVRSSWPTESQPDPPSAPDAAADTADEAPQAEQTEQPAPADLDSLLNQFDAIGAGSTMLPSQTQRLPMTSPIGPNAPETSSTFRLPTPDVAPAKEETSLLSGEGGPSEPRIARLPQRLGAQTAKRLTTAADAPIVTSRVYRDVPAGLIIRQPQ